MSLRVFRRARCLVVLGGALLGPAVLHVARAETGSAPEARPSNSGSDPAPKPAPSWCAPDLEVLGDGVCFSPAPTGEASPKTLVIFLHSLVGAGSNWQWEQQRMVSRHGQSHGYSVLMPRGRLGIGPGRTRDVYAWPGSPATQKLYEDSVLGEWDHYRAGLERRYGAFEEVFVFGFSNGAYYATTLAMRGRLAIDGYGVFAGGSGSKYHRILGEQTSLRAPVFVGYGTKDPDHPRQQALVELLSDLHWAHHSLGARVGHLVTDGQLSAAISFLRARRGTQADRGGDSES